MTNRNDDGNISIFYRITTATTAVVIGTGSLFLFHPTNDKNNGNSSRNTITNNIFNKWITTIHRTYTKLLQSTHVLDYNPNDIVDNDIESNINNNSNSNKSINEKQNQQQQYQNSPKSSIAKNVTLQIDNKQNNNEQQQQQQEVLLLRKEISILQQQRQEERTGRIRAEIKLRNSIKKLQQIYNNHTMIVRQKQHTELLASTLSIEIKDIINETHCTTPTGTSIGSITPKSNFNNNSHNKNLDDSFVDKSTEITENDIFPETTVHTSNTSGTKNIQKDVSTNNGVELSSSLPSSTSISSLLSTPLISPPVITNTNTTLNNTNTNTTTTILMESIGIVHSPFIKRMGTPRQSQLVSASYGYIQFNNSNCPNQSLDGIMEYSHIWIIFEFHANTDINNSSIDCNSTTNTTNTTTSSNYGKKTKIRPPRSPYKVGQLATRTPHRINPIGLSLVSVVSYDNNKNRLYISGFDLVHGTPVYDIKPCVPWDIPGYYQIRNNSNNTNNNTTTSSSPPTTTTTLSTPPIVSIQQQQQQQRQEFYNSMIQVPYWVNQEDDIIPKVTFTHNSLQQLKIAIIDNKLLEPYYTSNVHGYNTVQLALQQILSQDPRSSHKGLKHNARGSTSTTSTTVTSSLLSLQSNELNNHSTTEIQPQEQQQQQYQEHDPYHIIFGQIQVSFIVLEEESDKVESQQQQNATTDTTSAKKQNEVTAPTMKPAPTSNIGIHIVNIQYTNTDKYTHIDGIPLILNSSN